MSVDMPFLLRAVHVVIEPEPVADPIRRVRLYSEAFPRQLAQLPLSGRNASTPEHRAYELRRSRERRAEQEKEEEEEEETMKSLADAVGRTVRKLSFAERNLLIMAQGSRPLSPGRCNEAVLQKLWNDDLIEVSWEASTITVTPIGLAALASRTGAVVEKK